MKILFCGTIVPTVYDTKLKYMSPAANRFQINICETLVQQGHDVSIVSYIGFPMEEKFDFASEESFFPGKIEYVYKQENTRKSIAQFASMLKAKLNEVEAVFAYNVTYAWLGLPAWSKRKNVKSVLLLADYTEAKTFRSVFMKIYAQMQYWSIRRYQYVVGLSENVERFLGSKQYFYRMEGGISRKLYELFTPPDTDREETLFMYAGLLEPVTGIDILLEAFCKVQHSGIRLLISGKGNLENVVEEYCKKDSRITYLGYMEYEEYLRMLSKVDVLVNPRNMNLEENQNNFPSKVMEYLATGKYIMSTKFVGYTRFCDAISFCESDVLSMEATIETMADVCKENRNERYEKNREFAQKFLWDRQVANLIDSLL